jgi:hypothetical protein
VSVENGLKGTRAKFFLPLDEQRESDLEILTEDFCDGL